MTYWWDFCPRMVHLGIWDNVYLDVMGDLRLEDIWVRPALSDDFSRADILIALDIAAAQETNGTIETTIQYQGQIISSAQATYTGQRVQEFRFSIDRPHLWWPNGHGEQPLYTAEVRISDRTGESDRRIVPFGIRRIEFIPNETSDPTARPYTLVVNGKTLYIKGWNWVPMDVMYGVERPQKLERLLTLAKRANVNMLRVWGGGLIEKEAFYALCDQFGILIWQEFIQSSSGIDNNPPTDPQMISMMVQEAEQIIPRRRNHPSLAIWCGGNELHGEEQPLGDEHPMLAALHDVVKRLDPDRHWLPTSPTGRVFMNSLESIARDPSALHDVHGPWEHQGLTGQYTLYNRGTSLLHSEFGAEGITNLKTLHKVISAGKRWPVTLDNPVWEHLGAWWVKEKPWHGALGEVNDLERLVRGTQYLQAEGVRYAIEANSRRQFQNSGSLPWQFNEPYPMAACTSAVDYYTQPKPLYYAVKRAYEPRHGSAKFESQVWANKKRFEAALWLCDSINQPYEATLRVRLIGFDGQVYAEKTLSIVSAGQQAMKVADFEAPLSDVSTVFFLDLALTTQAGQVISHNRNLFICTNDLHPALVTPETALQTSVEGETLKVTNLGAYVALFVWIEDAREADASGYVYLDDNHICIDPGESATVDVEWRDVAPSERWLRIAG